MLITLLDAQALCTRRLHQPLAHALIESGIGWETVGLGLHGRVHVDALQLGWSNRTHRDPRLNRRAQHLLGSGLAQSLAPARHARRINRHRMLKVRHAAEVLPIWVLNPNGDHVLIAQIILELQIVQSPIKRVEMPSAPCVA